jgi:hypothetical protein
MTSTIGKELTVNWQCLKSSFPCKVGSRTVPDNVNFYSMHPAYGNRLHEGVLMDEVE